MDRSQWHRHCHPGHLTISGMSCKLPRNREQLTGFKLRLTKLSLDLGLRTPVPHKGLVTENNDAQMSSHSYACLSYLCKPEESGASSCLAHSHSLVSQCVSWLKKSMWFGNAHTLRVALRVWHMTFGTSSSWGNGWKPLQQPSEPRGDNTGQGLTVEGLLCVSENLGRVPRPQDSAQNDKG